MSVSSSGAVPAGNQGARYFSLRWNSHPVELVSGFTGLYQSETLVDVTLAAEGKHLQAHKMLLSACSDYFQSLFSINPCQHPIVILKDVNFDDLQTIVQFMYNGTVNISGEKLPDIMKVCFDSYFNNVASEGKLVVVVLACRYNQQMMTIKFSLNVMSFSSNVKKNFERCMYLMYFL